MAEINDWISQQARLMCGDWEKAIEIYYPQYANDWKDPVAHLSALRSKWNLLAAVEWLNWKALLEKTNLNVLDLGAGTGWLSAYLSCFENVSHIDALDSSVHNLTTMFPRILEEMVIDKKNIKKIKPILGFFTPILREDNYYDIVIASSSIHHADSITVVLKEVYRVLKNDGYFIILNEPILSKSFFCYYFLKTLASIVLGTVRNEYSEKSPALMKNCILYDPFLGDRTYTMGFWLKSFEEAGFSYNVLVTPFSSYKNDKHTAPKLVHFVLKKLHT